MEKKSILVASSSKDEVIKFTQTLQSIGYITRYATTVKETINLAASKHPNLILICNDFKETIPLSLIRSLRKWLDTPIIILADAQDEKTIVAALDAGAHDFFVTPFGSAEHFARIRAAIRAFAVQRHRENKASRFSLGGLQIDYSTRNVTIEGQKIHLTPIEYRILSLLTKNAGKTLTHDQIIDEIWGLYNSDSLVLRVNIANIRRKIEKNQAKPAYIFTEVGVGYRVG
ncbi:MAG: response regulator transcription factor [Defluviitaleaceae bacterium]|nr:response regulator transcription factor [Defluviitaleaceae bacterium]